MARHPRNAIIMQVGGLVVDLDSVDHAAVLEEGGGVFVAISFRASPKVTKVRAEDRESAMILLSRVKRGMVCALTGDLGIIDDPPDQGDDDDDDDKPKAPE